ncbi:MAG: hypothetical protein ACO1OG_01155 [Devosia sp.]
MRTAALILGLIAGALVLAEPLLFRTNLMGLVIERWATGESGQHAAMLFWIALPAAALVGALLALPLPGIGALLLFAAAIGWASIALGQPDLLDHRLLAPAGCAFLAGALAQLAAELSVRHRREDRRERRAEARADRHADADDIAREAALRFDTTVVPRDEMPPPPPRRAVPLTLDDVSVTARPTAVPEPVDDDIETLPPEPQDNWKEPFEPEPFRPQPTQSTRRPGGFRWDDADEPAIEVHYERPRQGPRFEPREPARGPERVEFVTRSAPTPPPPPPPQPAPQPAIIELEPEVRFAPQAEDDQLHERRDRGVLMPVLAGIFAVVLVGALTAGGYFAYRQGYLDPIIGAATPTSPTPAPVAEASPEPEATTSEAVAPIAQLPVPASDAAPPVLPVVLPELPAPADTTIASYDDPFAYCTAVETVDFPDSRYTGPAVIPAMTQLLRTPAEARQDRVHWRCMEGRVLACASYAGPICDMAPTVSEMQAYCERNPNAQPLFAPHGIWSCVEGRPQLPANVNWPVDARGFMPRAWIAVSPPTAAGG